MSFAVIHLAPGEPGEITTGDPNPVDWRSVQQMREIYDLDKPLYVQYWKWLSAFLRGDWGRSLLSNRPVAPDIRSALANSIVLGLLGAANHDPARFSDPERLDVGRDEGPPMSFGGGIHFCLGAALARLEGQIVFDRLLARFGTMELVGGPPAVRDSLTLRGLVDLKVRFAA